VEAAGELAAGREHYARQAWSKAYEALSRADASAPLGPNDLERLATSAYMLGREQEYRELLERAYRGHLEADDPSSAFHCAHWIGMTLAAHGELGRAGGWLGRAERLLEREGLGKIEGGYALIPRIFEHEAAGDLEGAAAIAAEAAAVGERFGDPDLFALAAHVQGHVLIRLGRLREGLALLDMSMVGVTAGEVSPICSGIVYCGVILACEAAHELRRAKEWTTALTDWCERQPDLVAFTGRCLVHRAQIMRMQGSWDEAIDEARRAAERCLQGENQLAAGEANYQRGEVHRLRGEHRAAEQAYREASRHGWEPQPGLALLRVAQGRDEAGVAAIRRAAAEAGQPSERATLLPAYVEIMLVAEEYEAAEQACAELEAIAAEEEEPGALSARAAEARGRLELTCGRAETALVSARRAGELWQRLEAPYERARARELVGLACRELGDEDTARLELEGAADVFSALGAATDLSRVERAAGSEELPDGGLTKRELEVLRLLCAGRTNRQIAESLVLSVRTVDRHVSNIYAKLGVSSRAAATGYAHEHGLV
jgi:DNA-binding CsgD family transcriptional regulator